MIDEAVSRRACMQVALGREFADVVIQGGTLVDVNIGQTYPADVAIKGDRIAYVGDCAHTVGPGTEIHDATGRFITPSFFDCHIHMTGVQVNMTELAKVMIAHGTTVNCTDLYEAAILGGLEAMRFCLDELNSSQMKTLLTIGHQIFSQNRDLGNTNRISAEDMLAALRWPETIGISEWRLWFYASPEDHDPVIQQVFDEVWERDMILVGHAHSYPTKDVNAYAAVAGYSDHEANSDEDALEKLKAGYRIMIKENASIHNTKRIVPLITERGIDSRNLMWNSDHTSPAFLLRKGNVDAYIREAIQCGLDPITAVQMGSLNAAEYFRVTDDLGSVAPGRIADIVLVDGLESFEVREVFTNGKLVARDGEFIAALEPPEYPAFLFETMKVGRVVKPEDFHVPAPEGKLEARARVIGLPYPIIRTEAREAILPVVDGHVRCDPERDILKIAVLDRNHASGNTVTSFVQGAQMKQGAYATSFHAGVEDIGIIGTNEEDMAAVANCLVEMGGGAAAAVNGEIVARVEMPLLGLIPTDSLEGTVLKWEQLFQVLQEKLDNSHPTPVRAIRFPCNPRSTPTYKICQAGLVEVTPSSAVVISILLEDGS